MLARFFILGTLIFSNLLPTVTTALNITAADVVDKTVKEGETFLTEEDFAAAPHTEVDLAELGIQTSVDPTMGSKSEGDIAIANIKKFVESNNKLGRNAIRQVYRRWSNGEIPYTLSTQYGAYSRSIIAKAIQEYHDKTCVKFVPRDPRRHRDYVYIHPDDGCYSLVGRTGGRQPLSLDSGCIQTGTIVHELMHTVGFFHEQSRADRDEYIEIIWQNVLRGADDQFEKYGLNVLDHLNEPYDYSSIMHYGPYAFSDNGRRTIVARKPGAERMGQRVAFSEIDLRKINKLYNCQQTIIGNSINDGLMPSQLKPTEPSEECKDNNWRCPFWSMSIFNYCENYEDVRTACRKSCNLCETASTTQSTPSSTSKAVQNECMDLKSSCKRWAMAGHCKNMFVRGYMRKNCPASCGYCGECRDTAPAFTCKLAAMFDECNEKSDTCAKSCGIC